MLWWRKRNEGFEWRDYVRTTILVRREQRRQRLKDVQAAAAAHVKDAGRRGLDAGIHGARNAGTGTWSGLQTAWTGLKAIARTLAAWIIHAGEAIGTAVVVVISGLGSSVAALARRIGEPLGPVLEPVLARARAPRAGLALKIVAALAGLGAVYRTWTFSFDADAVFATLVFAVAAIIALLANLTDPRRDRSKPDRESLLSRLGTREFELPGERRLSVTRAGLGALAVIAIAAAGTAAYHYAPSSLSIAGRTTAPVTTGAIPDMNPLKLEGRAIAVTGDTLRIGGTNARLDGIDAPEATQSCGRSKGGTWRCGVAAKDALASIVRGKRISCDILGEEETAKRARCYAGDKDIAEELVRAGNVFADGGFWSAYASVENDAEERKVGLWAGDSERPQDYRDKRWEEASKSAPDGCPIKGPIRSGTRIYVLPWAPNYDGIRLRTSRGERWFCSEREAEAAGWTRGS